jgi:PAS domain S-box-containing protein
MPVLIFVLLNVFISTIAYGSEELLDPEERLWLENNQSRLVLAVETGNAPFVFVDSEAQLTGLAHDYMLLIETKLGVQFHQKQFSSRAETFQEVRSGKVHIVNAVTSTPARLKFLAISNPFISVPNVIIVRKEYPGQVSEQELSGLKVSMVKSAGIKKYVAQRGSQFIPDLVPDDLTALLNVSLGRSDAAVIDLVAASYLISEKGMSNNLRIAGKVAYDNQLSIAVPLSEPILFDILQKGLGAITDAERDEIKHRWMNGSESQSNSKDLPFWSILAGLIVVAFVILAIIFLRNSSFRSHRILPLLVMISGLAATYFFQQMTLTNMQKNHQDDFEYQAREILLRIESRLDAYAQVLRGAKALFAASKSVEREEFRDYVAGLHLADNYAGIQGVGFSLIIPPQEKDRHVKAFRKEGFPNYKLWPVSERDLYTSIVYLEPFAERNLRAFGYDMYSEPVRRAAMERSRDLGQPVMSGKVLLVQESGKKVQAGFLIYVPVYRNGSPHVTLTERRANIIGWSYAPFRMNDLMFGILGNQVNNIDIEIYDSKSAASEALMYDSGLGQSKDAIAPHSFSDHLEILDYDWTVRLHSLPDFEASSDAYPITMIRLAGIVWSILFALLVWQLLTGRIRTLKLASALGLTEKAKVDLQESEFRWKFAIEGADDGLWDWDLADNISFFSKRWKEMLGFAEDDFNKGRSEWKKHIHPDDKAPALAALQECLDNKKKIYSSEYRIRCKDGNYIWVLDRGVVAMRSEDGKPLRMIGTQTDITERRKADEMLHRFSVVVDQSPITVMITDKKGGIEYVNPQFTKDSGYSVADTIGQNPRIFQSGQTPKETYQELWRNLVSGQAWHGELFNKRKNGELYWEEVHIAPIKNPEGFVTHYVALKNDITERKHSEDELQKAKEALMKAEFFSDQALELAHAGYWNIDFIEGEADYYVASERVVSIMGGPPRDGLRYHIMNDWYANIEAADKTAAEKAHANYLAAVDGSMPRFDIIHPYKRPSDGNIIWMHVMGDVVRDAQGEPTNVYGVAMDVTALHEHEEELLRSNAELEQFSFAVSHDMRQPLRMISSYLQLLEVQLADQLDAEKREYFNYAVEGAKRMDQMLLALLDYSRIGRMGEPATWIDSRAVLDEALQFLEPAIAESQARINISGDWERIFACRNEMQRLFQNIIGNAVKYRVAGRTPEIDIIGEIVDDEWHLCVTDNGVGIVPNQINRLFKVFQRLHTRDVYEGAGLGLALCRKIVEHHKGRIWAESTGEGLGSQFCVALPVLARHESHRDMINNLRNSEVHDE